MCASMVRVGKAKHERLSNTLNANENVVLQRSPSTLASVVSGA